MYQVEGYDTLHKVILAGKRLRLRAYPQIIFPPLVKGGEG